MSAAAPTKVPALAAKLAVGDVLISEDAKLVLDEVNAGIELECFDLEELDVQIRDFPETGIVFAMRPTDSNHARLVGVLEELSGTKGGLRENNQYTPGAREKVTGASRVD